MTAIFMSRDVSFSSSVALIYFKMMEWQVILTSSVQQILQNISNRRLGVFNILKLSRTLEEEDVFDNSFCTASVT